MRTRTNQFTALPSAARTATTATADLENRYYRGIVVRTNVSAIAATPSITVSIEYKDVTSGAYVALLTGAALTGVSSQVLKVYPGLTASANAVANDVLPQIFRINVVHGDSDSITYSVDVNLVP